MYSGLWELVIHMYNQNRKGLTMMNKKIISILIMCLLVVELTFSTIPVKAETGYFELTATAASVSEVRLTWNSQKNISQYKIYRAVEDPEQGTGKYKLIAKISGKRKSYTDKKLKQEQSYSYIVKSYKNKKLVSESYASAYTGLVCTFDDYQHAEAARSPKFISLKLHSEGGIKPTGYIIYRKEMGIKGYKKIATVKKNAYNLVYKDKTVTAGKKYRYKVKTYLTVGKKKYYSALTDFEQMSAINQTGKYTVRIDSSIACKDNQTVYKITSKKYNGTVKLNTYGEIRIEQNNGTSMEPAFDIISYKRTDGKWKKCKEYQQISLKANETIWIKVQSTNKEPLQSLKGKNISSYEVEIDASYDGISSIFTAYPLSKSGATSPNSEAIH